MRAYTMDEIDAMRNDLSDLMQANATTVYNRYVSGGPSVDPSNIEDRLRTYMQQGVEPAELHQALCDAQEQLSERQKSFKPHTAKPVAY